MVPPGLLHLVLHMSMCLGSGAMSPDHTTPLQITAVVLERELKLRQALKTMGMMDSTFWSSWTTYEVVMGLITALLLAGFGAMWQVSTAVPRSLSWCVTSLPNNDGCGQRFHHACIACRASSARATAHNLSHDEGWTNVRPRAQGRKILLVSTHLRRGLTQAVVNCAVLPVFEEQLRTYFPPGAPLSLMLLANNGGESGADHVDACARHAVLYLSAGNDEPRVPALDGRGQIIERHQPWLCNFHHRLADASESCTFCAVLIILSKRLLSGDDDMNACPLRRLS